MVLLDYEDEFCTLDDSYAKFLSVNYWRVQSIESIKYFSRIDKFVLGVLVGLMMADDSKWQVLIPARLPPIVSDSPLKFDNLWLIEINVLASRPSVSQSVSVRLCPMVKQQPGHGYTIISVKIVELLLT